MRKQRRFAPLEVPDGYGARSCQGWNQPFPHVDRCRCVVTGSASRMLRLSAWTARATSPAWATIPAGGNLGGISFVVPGHALPCHAALPGHELDMAVARGRLIWVSRAQDGRSPWWDDHLRRLVRLAGGSSLIHRVSIVGPVRGQADDIALRLAQQVWHLRRVTVVHGSPEPAGPGRMERPTFRHCSGIRPCRSRATPSRRRSSGLGRPLSPAISRASSFVRCWCVTSRARVRQRRRAARARIRATRRSRADAPGSSTFSVTSQTVARSKSTLGRSVPVQHSA